MFKLVSKFKPKGDQPDAIKKLLEGCKKGKRHQVLLGATGTGKSVTHDTPVYIYKKDTAGQYYPILVPIGQIADLLFSEANFVNKNADTEVLFPPDIDEQYFVPSFDSLSNKIEIKPITAFIRHKSPKKLYKVATSCGRCATFTGDHNFFVLRNGKLQLVETTDLKKSDYIPLPVDLGEINQQQDLDCVSLQKYVSGKAYVYAKEEVCACVAACGRAPVEKYLSGSKLYAVSRFGEGIKLSDFFRLKNQFQILDCFDISAKTRLGETNFPLKYPLTDEFLEFLGIYIAEGWACSNYVLVSAREREFFARMTSLIDSLNLIYKVRPNGDTTIFNELFAGFLSNLCGKGSARKHLPEFWPKLSLRQLGVLLRGYFSGDGGVDGGMVTCTTKSKTLSSELLYALSEFGIWARSHKRFKRAVNSDHAGDFYYCISISGQDNLVKFKNSIGFSLDRKSESLDEILGVRYNTNVDVIPGIGDILTKLRKQNGLFQKDLADMAGLSRSMIGLIEKGDRNISRIACERLISGLTARFEKNKLVSKLNSYLNLRWTSVGNVSEIVSKEKYVYDFSVKDNETFLAGYGGMFVHNTFVMANLIQELQKPTLIISHNKTLAAQLCSEFREFFPENAVSYFVSYYDYYQPEAYMPATDTYIEKDATINEEIEKYRHAATMNLLTRKDVIVVSSVSCIYGIGAPDTYEGSSVDIKAGDSVKRDDLLRRLADMQYTRSQMEFKHGMFHVLGDTVEIFPPDRDTVFRVEFFGDDIEKISECDAFTGEEIGDELKSVKIFPAKHDVTSPERIEKAVFQIRKDLDERYNQLLKMGKNIEAERIKTRTEYDIEILLETGYCTGIENYTRYLNDLKPGEPTATLLDYFPEDFLMIIDESHITVPQVGGMFNGNYSRKTTLVEHGFRLPSSYDNRPLRFNEFEKYMRQVVYTSATPSKFELEKSRDQIVEQIIRPTGLLDPKVCVKPTKGQIQDIIKEINEAVSRKERVLLTTLTKRSAEDLTEFLKDAGIRVRYLHSDIETLERIEILRDLRLGKFDVLVGINLLREGLDLPEVSFIGILDADKQGFLRSTPALIQTIGRCARNVNGHVTMYADKVTDGMKGALSETERRRKKQEAYNKKHDITPQTIKKAVSDITIGKKKAEHKAVKRFDTKKVPKEEIGRLICHLEEQMDIASQNLEFEKAAELRDEIENMREEFGI